MLNEIINIDLHIHSCFSDYKDGASLTAKGEKAEIEVALEAMYRLQKEMENN